MKKALLSLSFVFAVAGSLAAQSEFAPIGAVWHYSSTLAFSPPSFIRLEVVSDSVVMGRPCSKLDMLNFYWPEPGMLLHQHGDSVLFYNPLVGDFDLLYPFGAQAGTMWTHRVAYPQSGDTTFLQYRLDSVSLVTIQNRELRRLHISKAVENAYYPIAEVTESIGSSYFILYSFLEFTYALYNIVYEGPFPDGLRCYYDPAFGLYETGLALGCDAVSAKDMPEPEDIRVFPNPVSDRLHIENLRGAALAFELMDLHGRTLRRGINADFRTEVSVAQLPAGVYQMVFREGTRPVGRTRVVVAK